MGCLVTAVRAGQIVTPQEMLTRYCTWQKGRCTYGSVRMLRPPERRLRVREGQGVIYVEGKTTKTRPER